MATKISDMTSASALTGAESLEVVQSSATRKTTALEIAALSTHVFVYQPGGTAAGNVYADLATCCTAMAAISGRKRLYVDNSITAIPTLPAGTFDFTSVPWESLGTKNIEVKVDDGTTLTGLRDLKGIILTGIGTTGPSPIVDLAAGDRVHCDTSTLTNGAIPLFDASGLSSGTVSFYLRNVSPFGDGTNPVVQGASGLTVLASEDPTSEFRANCFDVPAGGTLVTQGNTGAQAESLGTELYVPITSASYSVTAVKTSSYNASVEDCVRCDPSGGAFPVNLPAIHTFNGGHKVSVKNTTTSTTAITVTPAGSDTIDGAATKVVNSSRGGVVLVSDGSGDWMIESEV